MTGGSAHFGRALNILDEGIRRFGTISSLQQVAIDIERKTGRFDAALSRLETLIAQGDARERRLFQKAEILFEAKRFTDAEDAYNQAGILLRGMPPAEQISNTQLTKEIDARLGALRNVSSGKE